MLARFPRIAAIAVGFFVVFSFSQQATAARNFGQTTPGISWAIGVLSLLFLIAAYVNERMRHEDPLRKDMLWGLGLGGIAIVLSRLQ